MKSEAITPFWQYGLLLKNHLRLPRKKTAHPCPGRLNLNCFYPRHYNLSVAKAKWPCNSHGDYKRKGAGTICLPAYQPEEKKIKVRGITVNTHRCLEWFMAFSGVPTYETQALPALHSFKPVVYESQ